MADTVVFDLGRVLIDFSWDPFAEFLRSRGAQFTTLRDLADKVRMEEYERGLIDSDTFVELSQGLLSNPTTKEELINKWNDIFNPFDEMLELAKGLSRRYKVCILSNTCELHWDHLIQTYQLEALSHHRLASFHVGMMKPDEGIYREVERMAESKPEEIVFLDDKEENILGAKACGWNAYLHSSHEASKRSLEKHGIKLNS